MCVALLIDWISDKDFMLNVVICVDGWVDCYLEWINKEQEV